MKHIHASIEVDASTDRVWELIADFDRWPAWGPTVADVESEETTVAPGVTGRVKTVAGPWLPFEITEVDRGRSWTWKVAGIPATGHRVTALDHARTLVEFTVPIAVAPYALILRAGLRRLKSLAEQAAS